MYDKSGEEYMTELKIKVLPKEFVIRFTFLQVSPTANSDYYFKTFFRFLREKPYFSNKIPHVTKKGCNTRAFF